MLAKITPLQYSFEPNEIVEVVQQNKGTVVGLIISVDDEDQASMDAAVCGLGHKIVWD